jgi:hypothetical protein
MINNNLSVKHVPYLFFSKVLATSVQALLKMIILVFNDYKIQILFSYIQKMCH